MAYITAAPLAMAGMELTPSLIAMDELKGWKKKNIRWLEWCSKLQCIWWNFHMVLLCLFWFLALSLISYQYSTGLFCWHTPKIRYDHPSASEVIPMNMDWHSEYWQKAFILGLFLNCQNYATPNKTIYFLQNTHNRPHSLLNMLGVFLWVLNLTMLFCTVLLQDSATVVQNTTVCCLHASTW